MKSVGIIGQGYVGTAVKTVFEKHYDIKTYDKYEEDKTNVKNIAELITESDLIFVCVPTPMDPDGSCNITIVEEVIDLLNLKYKLLQLIVPKVIAIKSTIPPGTTKMLQDKYNTMGIVFNPEFLTEANFIEDFKNQDRIIIGGDRPHSTFVKEKYSKVFPNAKIIKTGSKTAEMVKYFTNSFLATKVSFANEMKEICDVVGIDYDKVVEYSTYDNRLGTSHWAVPGPDGKRGFGGSCFPKDINAVMSLAYDWGVTTPLLKGAWDRNLISRPEKDWEELKGRAVTDSKDVIMGATEKFSDGVKRLNQTKIQTEYRKEHPKEEDVIPEMKPMTIDVEKKDDDWELKA